MKLSYRGVEYHYSPLPLELEEGDLIGKYRGRAYRVHRYPRHLPIPQAPLDLKYRGVEYKTHQCEEPVYPGMTPPEVKPNVTQRPLGFAATHCQNLLKNVEYRLQVAQIKGDRTLIQQLERERDELYRGDFCSLA